VGHGRGTGLSQALLVLPIIYAAYFFPPRWAWPLTIEIVGGVRVAAALRRLAR